MKIIVVCVWLLLATFASCEAILDSNNQAYDCGGKSMIAEIDISAKDQSVVVTSPFVLYMHGSLIYDFEVFTSGLVKFNLWGGNTLNDSDSTFNIMLSYHTQNKMKSLKVWKCLAGSYLYIVSTQPYVLSTPATRASYPNALIGVIK